MLPKVITRSNRVLLLAGLLLPIFLIGVPALLAYRVQAETKSAFELVTHTLEVEGAIQAVINSLVDAETGQRGFLLTGRDTYLEPYDAGIKRVGQQVQDLRTLTADNRSQQDRLRELDPLIAERLSLLAQTIATEKGGDHEGALGMVNSGRGKFVMDKIRGVLRLMGDEEHRLLWIRQMELSKQASRIPKVLVTMVLVSAAFAAGLLYLFYRLSRLKPIVTMCAASRTIEYQGEWLSFEEYLQRRFGIDTSHGMSPDAVEDWLARN